MQRMRQEICVISWAEEVLRYLQGDWSLKKGMLMIRNTSLTDKGSQRCRKCMWWVGHCTYHGELGCYWDEVGEELNYENDE